MSFVVVIPARFASTRLAGKLLLPIQGKTVLEHTWQQAKKSAADRVIIATDHQEIFDRCQAFGAEVCMTANNHESGTDRIAEVASQYQFSKETIVVNLQGDEPLMPPEYITQVAKGLQNDAASVMSTLATPLAEDEKNNPNAVKVVMDKQHHALYFGRAILPYPMKPEVPFQWYRHLGMYAYKASFLQTYAGLEKSSLEQVESLEQLRVLWHGYKIHVGVVKNMPGTGVDTKEDFEQVKAILEQE